MTDGHLASLSWCKAPIFGPWPDLYYCWTVEGFLMWGALSDERMGLSSAVILGSESHRAYYYILLSQIWDSPNLEGQVPTFTSPRNRGALVIPPGTGFHFIASYGSQDYGGDIRSASTHGPVLSYNLELYITEIRCMKLEIKDLMLVLYPEWILLK
jgi:hypothetical protein